MRLAQERQEERSTDDGGQDAEGDLDGRHGAGERVDEQQVTAAQQRGRRQETREAWTHEEAGEMRDDQAHPADDAGGGDGRRGDVAAATIVTRKNRVGTLSARLLPPGRLIAFMRQRNVSSASVPMRTGASKGRRSAALVPARLPSSQNVMAGSWL